MGELSNPKSVVTEQRLSAFYQAILPYLGAGSAEELIGVLSNLTTEDKTNLVAAINELNADKQENLVPDKGINLDSSTNKISADITPAADMRSICYPLPSGGGSDIIYSTTEQRIGRWIDGKVLYRKVFEVTTGSLQNTDNTLVDLTSLGIEDIISISAVLKEDENNFVPVMNAGGVYISFFVEDWNLKEKHSEAGYSSKTAKIIMEYTHANSIPNGSTVTPTDDVQILLECAEIYAPYTTISEVLADSVTFNAVLSNANAMAYFARSTTWIPTICTSSSVMESIGANNTASDALLTSEDWTLAILDSAYYSSILNVEVPVMTSYTTPSGTASASSEYSASTAAWIPFDDDDTTYWSTPGRAGVPQWVGYTFDSPMKIHACGLLANGGDGKDYTKDCQIQAYNDASSDTLLSFTVPSGDFTYTKRFISNSTAYTQYRLVVTSVYNIPPLANRLQFYGRRDVS